MKDVASGALLLGLSTFALSAVAAPVVIDLPKQPLAAALEQLQSASGMRISYDRAQVAKVGAPALKGNMEAGEALDRLLADSGLQGTVDGNSAQVSGTVRSKAAGNDSVDLGATEIVGAASVAPGTTEGTGSYTTGVMQTSTKLNMTVRETPQSVSVVTRQQMEDQNMQDLDDAIRGVTGMTVQQYGPARVSYAARGFDVDNIMYDGLVTSISTYTQDVISAADLAMFDRVEVVRGATGLMQGAGNPAAAVNMVRKRPTRDFHMSLEGSAGTWDRYRSQVDVSGPLNSEGTLRGRAVAAYETRDSFQDVVSGERGVLYGITEADLNPDTTLTLGASYQNDNKNDNWVGLPAPLGGRHLDLKRSDYYGADWSYWDTTTTHLFGDVVHRFDNGWQMKVAADKLWARIDMLGLYNSCYYTEGCPTMTMGPGKYAYTDDHQSYDAFANGPFQAFGREHELVFGGSYREERFDGHGGWGDLTYNDGSPVTPFDPTKWDPGSVQKPNIDMSLWNMKLDQEQKGAYVTTRLNVADPLKVILGGRLDWYEADPHNDTGTQKVTRNVTRYAGVVYDLNDVYSVYASYTDIFKPQSNFDASGSLLDPITGKNYEIGLKGEHFGGALNTQLAIFQIDQENRATDDTSGPSPCPSSPTSIYCSRASGKVRSQGVDMEVSGAITENWQAMAGYTYVDAKYKHDSNEDNVGKQFDPSKPRHLFKLATSYTLPGELHQWRVGGNLVTQSQTEDTTTGFQQGGYTVTNAMLGYKVNENIDTRVNFNNIFDKYYYSGISFGNLNYGEPRNLMFTVKYSM
ncbi:TonB-dependent siderophore receptor [Pseudomonas nitroreducens]|uniref:TonB-dependent siderophore receptor n=1 Tax=Pseudomonas nitroreducens TaxID=46680 RepID=UPI001FB8289B|nr:TonB-dependent siderophore receptor [Pseudomonas nitroreducens]MCJ1878136.1 TonB-dependent siderophore receptor [Pseudomonas nitroreducens]MCJ1894533.1 TonB-dependent siderophore receptor [Pseudomonas nitroreducens]